MKIRGIASLRELQIDPLAFGLCTVCCWMCYVKLDAPAISYRDYGIPGDDESPVGQVKINLDLADENVTENTATDIVYMRSKVFRKTLKSCDKKVFSEADQSLIPQIS